MSLYKFEKYKSKKENSVPNLTILVSKSEKISKAIKNAEIISDGVILCKKYCKSTSKRMYTNNTSKFCKELWQKRIK